MGPFLGLREGLEGALLAAALACSSVRRLQSAHSLQGEISKKQLQVLGLFNRVRGRIYI